jgi:hypothetical protein
MADVATPSAIDMAVGGQTTEAPKSQEKTQEKTRPQKPDDEQYKADLAEAEKKHAKVMERFVCAYSIFTHELAELMCNLSSRVLIVCRLPLGPRLTLLARARTRPQQSASKNYALSLAPFARLSRLTSRLEATFRRKLPVLMLN